MVASKPTLTAVPHNVRGAAVLEVGEGHSVDATAVLEG
jgi:hypothetical protein